MPAARVKWHWILYPVVAVQVACAVFFVSDIAMSVIGLRAQPISWQTKELLEIGASLGLVIGAVLGIVIFTKTLRSTAEVQSKLRAASGAFMDLVEEHCTDWGLTAAERDVAIFLLKGLSTAEIATLRETSQGTVKAQTNAIYRKSGVNGRAQLLSLFIDDLMQEALPGVTPHRPDTADAA